MKDRFKNYGLWVALFALGGMLLTDLGFTYSSERFQMYVDTILTIFIFLGIVNNPTTQNKWFLDDHK